MQFVGEIDRGLKDNLKFFKFRFDQEFKQINTEDFLRDFLNNASVRSQMGLILKDFPPAIKDIKYQLLNTAVTSMDFFDVIQKSGIAAPNGYIKKAMEEYVQEVQVADRLR